MVPVSKRSKRRFLPKLLVSLGVLVALLLVGEVLVRLLTDTAPPIVVRDAEVGRRFIASYEGEVYDIESEREVPLRFNSLGLRGPEPSPTPEPGVVRVAVLGDSMIAAVAVDEEDTLVHHLQGLLEASHPGVTWEVVNCGILGSSTGQELVLYRKVVRDLAPDLVLCGFFAGNDLADNSRHMTSNPRIYFDFDERGELVQLPYSVKRAAASRWLNRNSRLYVWQKERKFRFKVGKAAAGDEGFVGRLIYATEESEEIAHSWRITEALLAELDREVAADGARFGVFHIPCAQQVYRDSFEAVCDLSGETGDSFDWDHPDRRLAAICGGAGIPLFSLTAAFRDAAPSSQWQLRDEWLFLKGTGHWNEAGNEVGARALHAALTTPGEDGTSLVGAVLAAQTERDR